MATGVHICPSQTPFVEIFSASFYVIPDPTAEFDFHTYKIPRWKPRFEQKRDINLEYNNCTFKISSEHIYNQHQQKWSQTKASFSKKCPKAHQLRASILQSKPATLILIPNRHHNALPSKTYTFHSIPTSGAPCVTQTKPPTPSPSSSACPFGTGP